MLHNNVITHRVPMAKDGRVYVPQCIREMLPATLCAAIEEREGLGKCIAFYLKAHGKTKGRDVSISDGYLDVAQMCAQAGINRPFMWCAYTNAENTLEELLLYHDDAGRYKAAPAK